MLRRFIYNSSLTRGFNRLYRNTNQNNHFYNGVPRNFTSESFMQTVINQVKKDLEKDKSLQEAMEKLESESNLSEKISKLSSYIDKTKDFSRSCMTKISETKDNSELIKKCIYSAKSIAIGFDKMSNYLYDEKGHAKRIKSKMNLKSKAKTARPSKAESEHTAIEGAVNTEEADENIENALVLAKESVWERFGSRIRDMPFLSQFFENPVFSKLFGESSLAAALGEMKRIDASFNLPDLMELVEHVIAPHVVECYLKGDHDSLKLHCGETAFNILNTSIKERKSQKLELDPSILILKDVELKGGMKMKEGEPWLIFNFTTQQINCLRNSKGKVCAGRIDDIREVVYSIAISKHPNPLDTMEYPYLVRAIISS
ncbi:mitochondrial inner membrane subunit [Theileria orientalis]|uniref:Mitochondrial inner membrane subunit n=1 Tax=Theileria orientalis TaxID=68886 RepID=A0A976QWQ5_THEOR|nr:mitochondrial inner membrane subunit [Theileria orientalis]